MVTFIRRISSLCDRLNLSWSFHPRCHFQSSIKPESHEHFLPPNNPAERRGRRISPLDRGSDWLTRCRRRSSGRPRGSVWWASCRSRRRPSADRWAAAETLRSPTCPPGSTPVGPACSSSGLGRVISLLSGGRVGFRWRTGVTLRWAAPALSGRGGWRAAAAAAAAIFLKLRCAPQSSWFKGASFGLSHSSLLCADSVQQPGDVVNMFTKKHTNKLTNKFI